MAYVREFAGMMLKGPFADRPVASYGRYWYLSDEGGLYKSNGSAWTTVVSPGGGGAVSSVFTRTGAVVAANGDYYGVVASALTGATQVARFVGATTSGAPVSGTFAVGDFVIARNGHMFICTVAGTPGTWVDVGVGSGGIEFATSESGDWLEITTTDRGATLGSTGYYGIVLHDTHASSTGIGIASDYGDVGISGANAAFLNAGASNSGFVARSDTSEVNLVADGAFRVFNSDGDVIFEIDDDGTITPSGGSGDIVIGSNKLYDYTVSGSDKASIDTNVDGTTVANFAGYDILETFMLLRTDDGANALVAGPNIVVNNDTSGIYEREVIRATNATVVGASALAEGSWTFQTHGSGGSASKAGIAILTIPAYADTTFHKQGKLSVAVNDATAGNNLVEEWSVNYGSTSAITRIKVSAPGSTKFKVGSRLMVFGRGASSGTIDGGGA